MNRNAVLFWSAVLTTTACSSEGGDAGLDAGLPDTGNADTGAPVDLGLSDGGGPDDAGPLPDGGPTCEPPAPSAPGQVRTTHGTFQGTAQGQTFAYLGLPFAAPPVGARRLRAPEPPICQNTLQIADTSGPSCPQLDTSGAPVGEEDCLHLNVWAPSTPPATPMPVLVFIHGGGNNHGGNGQTLGGRILADGRALAELGNLVVTIQYRLGALGFLNHPLLDAESGNSGNWALLDQQAALAWIQANAAAFGADPARVVVFGESAGGLDICALYTSPRSAGLFHGAIIQSGGCSAAPEATARANADTLLSALGCAAEGDPLACLRSKTPAEILQAVPVEIDGLSTPPFGLSIDGVILPRHPGLALAAGEHLDVPLILGTNQNETYRMVPPPNRVTTEAAFQQFVRSFLAALPPAKVDEVLALYPMSDYASPHAALVALTTDVRWGCPGRENLKALSGTARGPLYRYYFTQGFDPAQSPQLGAAGAFHGIELFYLFNVLDVGGYVPTADDQAIAAAIRGYWSRFAATLDPNGEGAAAWPTYDATTDPYLQFAPPIGSGNGVRTTQCDALQAILR